MSHDKDVNVGSFGEPVDFNQVRYFVALADTLNFTRASERCYVSQSALTQAIKRLEDELGGKLIHRDGRNTELTELGKAIRHHFEQISHTKDLVRATAKAVTAGEIAEINIGIMCTVGPRLLANVMEIFQSKHPAISLILHDVSSDSIPKLLLSGALDGAFCARHGQKHPKLEHIELFEEEMVVAFPDEHEFSKKETVTLIQVVQQRYVDRLHCEFRDGYLEFCRANNVELNATFRSEREDWIQSMIRDGMGVSVIPRYSLLRPELNHCSIIEPTLKRNVEFTLVAGNEKSAALSLLAEQVKVYDWKSQVSITSI